MDEQTRLDQFRQAVQIYLKVAYREQPPPAVVQQRIRFPSVHSLERLLWECPAFETSEQRTRPEGNGRYRLRLGNQHYPNMKMAIQWLSREGLAIYSVDTHDRHISPPPGSDEQEAFRELQEFNARLKEEINAAWQEAGLPTFCEYMLAPPPSPSPAAATGLILVVEDEPDLLQAERHLLETDGYQVEALTSGSQALELVDRGVRPRACILDIMMPEMDGFRLCEGLRSRLGSQLPVIFVSSFPAETVACRVENYLEKPFRPDELLQKLRSLLR